MDIYDIIEYYHFKYDLAYSDLTMTYHIEKIKDIVLDEYKDINNIDYIEYTELELLLYEFSVSYINYLDYYMINIKKEFNRIDNIKVPEQRTKEWYIERSKLISASDASYAINQTSAFSNYNRTLLQKVGVKFSYFSTPAMLHGTIFEVVTQNVYETRNNVIIKEYGCLPHNSISYIGASPDGIVSEVKNINSLDETSLLGRMIEIKNPYSRVINDKIKFEYQIQIQVQLQVAQLYICDFIETKVTYNYSDVNEFLNDRFILDNNCNIINNKNIPITNLSKDGMEKGILLHFFKPHDDRDENISELFPLHLLYTSEAIEKWHKDTIKKFTDKGYQFIKCYYWKLEVYDVKTVKRDDERWVKEILPGLDKFWNDVKQTRKMTNKQIIERFDNIEEDNSLEETINPENNEIIKRKLRYVSKSSKKSRIIYKFSNET